MEEENIDLNFVQKEFLCCTPMNKFKWNDSNNGRIKIDKLSPEMQKRILEKTVNHYLVKNYPVKRSYQRTFLKLLINELEKSSQEIDEDMYDAYCSLVSSDDSQSSTQYKHFLYDASGEAITLQESVSIVSLGTTGLCTWQAGLGLAEWCITNKEILSGKKILELGCGVGLTGLAVIKTCKPMEYVFSDLHPSVLKMLCNNILVNLKPDDSSSCPPNIGASEDNVCLKIDYKGVNVEAMRLPWEEINAANYLPDSEIILAADVLYDDSCFDSLASALRHLLKSDGTFAVIAATLRNVDTIENFINILESYNLIFEEAEIPERKYFIRADETPIRIMKIYHS